MRKDAGQRREEILESLIWISRILLYVDLVAEGTESRNCGTVWHLCYEKETRYFNSRRQTNQIQRRRSVQTAFSIDQTEIHSRASRFFRSVAKSPPLCSLLRGAVSRQDHLALRSRASGVSDRTGVRASRNRRPL